MNIMRAESCLQKPHLQCGSIKSNDDDDNCFLWKNGAPDVFASMARHQQDYIELLCLLYPLALCSYRFWTLIQQSEVLLVLAQGSSITDLVSNLGVDCSGKGDDKVPNCIVWWCDAGCTFQHAEGCSMKHSCREVDVKKI